MIDLKDIELLEYAAKAAGYKKYYPHYLGHDSFVTYDEEVYSEVKEKRVIVEKTLDWNPFAYDGDALRLAVKLGIDYRPSMSGQTKFQYACKNGSTFSAVSNDPYAAARRAIVIAAAEIGKNMK